MSHIVDLLLAGLNRRLADRGLACELTPAARELTIDRAYDPLYGARPLRRYLQHTVETLVSRAIIAGEVREGQILTVDAENGELTLKDREVLQGRVADEP